MTAPNMSCRCFTEVSPFVFSSSLIHDPSAQPQSLFGLRTTQVTVTCLMSADVELLRMPHTRLDLAFRADKHVILSVERRGVGGLCFAHVLATV